MNKLSEYISHAVAQVATAVLFIATILNPSAMTAAKKNTSTAPDFAYPKTVQKNADKNLEAAIASGNWQKATLAIIQTVTAANIISHDSVTANLLVIDRYVQSAPADWKPVLQLIEADIYNSIYNNIRWKADQRELPYDSIPSNPYEWSRDMFANKIYSLCSEITASNATDNKPLKDWSGILTDADMSIKLGMTVDEFLLKKCSDLLNVYSAETDDVIPFFGNTAEASTPGQKCRNLRDKAIDMLIDKCSSKGQDILEANFLVKKADFSPYSLRQKLLMSAYEKLKDSEGSQLILQKLESNVMSDDAEDHPDFMIGKKQYADMLKKSIAQFPNGRYVNALKNILNNSTSPSANIEYRSQYLSSADISMNVTLNNCNQTYLLIYDYSKYKNATKSPSNSVIASNCRLAKAVKAEAQGTPPFSSKVSANIGTLPAGTYVVLPSSTSNGKGIYPSIAKQTWRQPFSVSDISVFSIDCLDATSRVFVVDGSDGHPIEGATVNIYTRKNYSSNRNLAATLTTNKEGFATVTEKNCDVEASYNGSKWTNNLRIYNTAQRADTTTRRNVTILPDRSIYHPGDSVCAVFIAYSSKENNLNLDIDKEFTIELHDANGKTVNSKVASTDLFGRATVNFRIPENGLLGNWSLYATDSKGKSYNYAYFQVADYVAPTFFITSEESENEITAGELVNLKGQVLTYSGMPLANAKVDYTVRYQPPMRWWAPSNATYDSSVSTDAEGKYVISLPTANLKNTQFERGVFNVNVSATSPSGETQSGPSVQFGIGQEYNISTPSSGMYFDISDSIPAIIFNVKDILGNNVKKKLSYILKNAATGQVEAEGLFESPSLTLPAKDYASAKYNLNVSLQDDPAVKSDISFVFWRNTDTTAPEGLKLWIPETDVYATPGNLNTCVTIGSGVRNRWIPIVLSGNNKLIDFKWLHINKENEKVPVVLPTGSDRFIMDVNFISDLDVENAHINFYGPEVANDLEIKTESFRNNISAGDNEQWKFRFNRKYGEVGEIPVMAVMTDAALNHLAPFRWNFAPAANGYNKYSFFRNNMDAQRYMDFNLKNYKYLSYSQLYFPSINNYGQNWGLYGYAVGGVVYAESAKNEVFSTVQLTSRSMNQMKMSAGAMSDMSDSVTEEVAVESEYDGGLEEPMASGPDQNGESNKDELRESECPVAFFMPYLTTDKDGVVDINFTVPNFNTTWQLQLLGYDESLQTAYKKLETVASKPVMVSTHSPRFVRTGDKIELTATIFNNTGSVCLISGKIELVNLLTGKTIATKEFEAQNLGASANREIEMQWEVPSDVSSVGFRAYAEGNGHRDGEQALLPVLPSSSPVTESTPFWLTPEQRVFEIQLPKFKNSDKVTLQYCDNPAWYCLTALPDIMETDSKSTLAKAFALYGNAMAFNLISSNLALKKGLETLLSDRNSEFAALKSNLEKDGNLKIAQLNNTPWVNDAESETLRMSRLSTLLDSANAEKVISEQLGSLQKLQTSEGGWSWCPDMQPSVFITSNILYNFAMMEKAGALDKFSNTSDMIKSAVGFVDKELVEQYRKYHKKDDSLSYLLNWMFTCSSLDKELIPTGKNSSEMATMMAKAAKDIASEWKDYGIGEKAKSAIVLWRNGQKKTALEILESLRQYASVTPQKGVWFDNLNSGYYGSSALATTTMVLKAFAEIEPENNLIDGLRQWLILSRQTEDWGRNIVTVETINAILTSGSNWTTGADANAPEFQLRARPVKLPETAALTGAFTVSLDAKHASGKKLKIMRSGNSPAWGGVVSQYEAPLKDIKAANLPEMSISKELVALVDEGNGSFVPKAGITLKKGMKVRVTLTITTDRDMDYVALTDERSACLEPTEQLSHYTATDGVWYYKEVRNENTNLYFDFLPKGHHVISYDCTVAQDGSFSCGIATLQSQYSPTLVCHSAAEVIEVK